MTTKIKNLFGLAAMTAGITAFAPGCLVDYPNDCAYNITLACFYNAGGSGGGTTSSGGGGTGGTPVTCIPSTDNAEIDASCGVFVSTSQATDSHKGTQADPYATIAEALAEGDGKPIYVCGETISEVVTIDAGEVELFGALDCTKGWLYDPAKKTKLTAAADSVPLTLSQGVTASLWDFQIEAVDAVTAGASSIAVIADKETTLALERCDVLAGAGADGDPGEDFSILAPGGLPGNDGSDACTANTVNGGEPVVNACDEADPEDDSISGAGGQGFVATGGAGSPGTPGSAMNGGTGQPNDAGTCTNGTLGDPGAAGVDGKGGKGIGTITAQGYQGIPAEDGGRGKTGQGGGGGGGAKGGTGVNQCSAGSAGGASGSSGGTGGCGGAGGRAGQAGGASIGLLFLGAQLAMADVTIATALGGAGGEAGKRQVGGPGGGGGLPGTKGGASALKDACMGAPGGKGGDGGFGGGGQGGPSLGIAYKGAPPDVKGATFTVGTPGDGGTAEGGFNLPILQGGPGLGCKTLSFDDGASSCVK